MGEGHLMPGKKHAPARMGRVLVLGLGKSGRATAAYVGALLGDRVESLTIAAGARTPEALSFLEDLETPVPVRTLFDCERVDGSFDLCIASPGIPSASPLYQSAAAASAEMVGEVEFAWRESASLSKWVAVTGTNGKTTVTSLVAHLLTCGGVDAKAVGNIGDTCIQAVAGDAPDVYVAEVSSYQLASTVRFAPDVAVLLNITPDHLHWHQTFEAYRAAKLRVLAHLVDVPDAVAVLDATDDEVRAEIRRLRAQSEAERGFSYVPVGTKAGLSCDMRVACGSENAAFEDAAGVLHVALRGVEHRLGSSGDLLIKGSHNRGNALAAAAAALSLGIEDEDVARGLRTFAPLEHRIEPCGSVRGIACYNDSKATNVDATLKALAAFPETRPVVLLGGDDKGTDLAPLVEAAHHHTRACVCFGAAASRFFSAFDAASPDAPDGFLLRRAAHLEDALDEALSLARPGEVLLLSPACASFDEFGSFEERGSAFKALVAARVATLGA